jgi:hypothetical protein
MLDLATQATGNYRSHVGFKFPEPPWSVPEKAFSDFNENYALAKATGPKLKKRAFEALYQDCVNAMHAVFEAMRGQGADEYEAYFLRELEDQCSRLLREEFDWYGKKQLTSEFDLSTRAVRDNALRLETGHHYFGQLSIETVNEIRAAGEEQIAKFRANAAVGKLTRGDLSVNTGPVVAKIRNILNREFRSLGVLDTLGASTGRKLKVVGLALELSVSQATWWHNAFEGLERPPKTLYAHLDETVSCPKAIVYVSDVTMQNGATSCYPRIYEALHLNALQELIGRVVGYVGGDPASPLYAYYGSRYHQAVHSEKFRRHFMRLPEVLRFNSHMGWDVLPDSELESAMTSNEVTMTGPAGTFIVFDGGRLFHRGGMVHEGERIALQVIFSDLTFLQRVLRKLKRVFA